jgi:myo-inositol-1(or 4)-monophosphatase
MKHWDVAAGVLIVQEAGGTVSGMDGAPPDLAKPHLIASNGQLHPQLVALVREFRAGARHVAPD